MITDEAILYIKNELANGLTSEIIRYNLKTQGWTDSDLDECFAKFNLMYPSVPNVAKPPNL